VSLKKLAVYGTYVDNVRRDIGSSTTGTSYTSSNPKIASVSPQGIGRSEGFGRAIVTVENSGVTVHIPVEVRPETP
jgi:hypothetical protein